jgi:hypothetical protein
MNVVDRNKICGLHRATALNDYPLRSILNANKIIFEFLVQYKLYFTHLALQRYV